MRRTSVSQSERNELDCTMGCWKSRADLSGSPFAFKCVYFRNRLFWRVPSVRIDVFPIQTDSMQNIRCRFESGLDLVRAD